MKTATRRTVLAASAWAVPVVLEARTAPSFATSDNTKPTCRLRGSTCTIFKKKRKGKPIEIEGYEYRLTVSCDSAGVTYVTMLGKTAKTKCDRNGKVLYYYVVGGPKRHLAISVLVKTTQGDFTEAVFFG